jgi:hypothetical protein
MDDHRSAGALIDAALARDLEAALAVDPSPDFVARVRTRVQDERDAAWFPPAWALAAAGALVVVAAIVGLPRPNVSQVTTDAPAVRHHSPAPRRDAAVATSIGPAPRQDAAAAPPVSRVKNREAPRRAAVVSVRRSASRDQPELLIEAGEARALQQLFSDVRQGLIDLTSLHQVAAAATLQPPSEIAFPPITIEPVATESAEEGERQ